ncbi:proline racemase family protein [Bacteroidota bacterium]
MKTPDLRKFDDFTAPDSWNIIKTFDTHTEGEPLRIYTCGYPEIKGDTILQRRKFFKEKFDHLRTALMFEPRGHADMYGCIITPPVSSEADFGVIFLHNEGYSTMCGHAIIALTKVVLETGMLESTEPETIVRIDSPAGLITSYAKIENNKVKSVYFNNVPSFVFIKERAITVPGIGEIKFDIAFGGAFYAFVKAEDAKIRMLPENSTELILKGMLIKNEIMNSYKIIHPFEKDLNFLYGTIFYGSPLSKNADSRNVCIFAEGELDRSPTGTGVSARLALHYDKGEMGLKDEIIVESILGTKFTGRIKELTKFGSYNALVPQIEGTAYITGRHEFFIDPSDPLKDGFILR